MVSPGDKLNVYVLKVDSEKRKIALSLKRAQPDAWEEVAGRYEPGQMVTGTITKLTNFGAFAHIEGPVEGLIHISELAERRIPHPKEVVKEGDVLTLKILRIDREHYRLGLSLKQALGELENLEQNRVHRQMEAMNQVASESPTLGDMADPESLEALVRMVRADDITVAETALEEETDSSAGDENASDPPVQV
ncbi:MAG: RNA-binding protein [Dehalococcoidia bacterium]|nr:RNA-binding protein [Dehalococcoidia bacterium]